MDKTWETLFKPYSGQGCTVGLMVTWLKTEGRSRGYGPEAINIALTQTFLELAQGKDLLGTCDCGCQDNPDPGKRAANNVHTRINHYILRRCEAVQDNINRATSLVLEKETTNRIADVIRADNEAFLQEQGIGMDTPEHTETDDLFDLLSLVYEKMDLKNSKRRARAGKWAYRRRHSIWWKPLGNLWREDIKPLFRN